MALLAGRFLFVDELGAGGMGTIWRVWDARERRYLAAKVMHSPDPDRLLRFTRERSVDVQHPHVLAPQDWIAADGLVLLTLDIVRGGNVGQLLGDYGSLPLPYATVLVDQLLSALTAVHAEGVIHRDIKPSNLLLEVTGKSRPVLRLADFGIATVVGGPRLTVGRQVVGTVGYLAPEAIAGAEPEPRQDLYSVGVVAYQLLTGRLPERKRAADGRSGTDPPTGSIPEQMWHVIRSLLDPSPAGRPRSADAARTMWRAAAVAAGVSEPAPADPDAIEVFDQIPPLPDGFGPAGPLGATDDGAPRPVPAPTAGQRRIGRRGTALAVAVVLTAGAALFAVIRAGGDGNPAAVTVDSTDSWTTVTPDDHGVATVRYCPRTRPCRFPAVPQVLVTARAPQNGGGIPAGLVVFGSTTEEFSLRALNQNGKPVTGQIEVWYHASLAVERPTEEVGTATTTTDDRGYATIAYRRGGRGAPVGLVAVGVRPSNGRSIPGSVIVTGSTADGFRLRVLSHTGAVVARQYVTVAYRASWVGEVDTTGHASRDGTVTVTTDASGFAAVPFRRTLPGAPDGIQAVGVAPAVAPGAAATVLAYSPTRDGFLVRILDAEGRAVPATEVTLSYHAVTTATG